MVELNIRLQTVSQVKAFVNLINQYSSKVDLISGHYIVDGKSIMGILSLDLNRPVLARIKGEPEDELLKQLQRFVIDKNN